MCKKMFVVLGMILMQVVCGMLPDDIVFNVMQYGDKKDYLNCALVCKQWHRVSHTYQYDEACDDAWSRYIVVKYKDGMQQKIAEIEEHTCPVVGCKTWPSVALEVIIDQKFEINEVVNSPLIRALVIYIDTKSVEEICFTGRVSYKDEEQGISYDMNAWSGVMTFYVNELIRCFSTIRALTLGCQGKDFYKFVALDEIDMKPLSKLESLKIVGADNLRMRVISVFVKKCPSLKKLSIIDSEFTSAAIGCCSENSTIKELHLEDVIVLDPVWFPQLVLDAENAQRVFDDIFMLCSHITRLSLAGCVGIKGEKRFFCLDKENLKRCVAKLKSLKVVDLVAYTGVASSDRKIVTPRSFKQKCCSIL